MPLSTDIIEGQAGHPGLHNEERAAINDLETALAGVVSQGAPDATSSVKGVLQLTNHLGGTASAPTVPGLATKADAADVWTKAQTAPVLVLATGAAVPGGTPAGTVIFRQ